MCACEHALYDGGKGKAGVTSSCFYPTLLLAGPCTSYVVDEYIHTYIHTYIHNKYIHIYIHCGLRFLRLRTSYLSVILGLAAITQPNCVC